MPEGRMVLSWSHKIVLSSYFPDKLRFLLLINTKIAVGAINLPQPWIDFHLYRTQPVPRIHLFDDPLIVTPSIKTAILLCSLYT